DGVVRLGGVRGCPAVGYFYPRDGTPGCTKETRAIRDRWSEFRGAGARLFGVSRQSRARHREFATEHRLPFPLVADESRQVQHAYGVPDAWLRLARGRGSILVDAPRR